MNIWKIFSSCKKCQQKSLRVFPLLIIFVIFSLVLLFSPYVLSVINRRYPKSLTTDDIKKEYEKLQRLNKYPNNKKINEKQYPKFIGIDLKNGRKLTEVYFCMDICPDYANVKLTYEGVTSQKECDRLGGETVLSGIPSPGIFLFCSPKLEEKSESDEPAWIKDFIANEEKKPIANPPAFLEKCIYQNQTVYYLPPRCCDIPGLLYDQEGNIICSPDGGITGQGNGQCSDFSKSKRDCKVIWKDSRAAEKKGVSFLASIKGCAETETNAGTKSLIREAEQKPTIETEGNTIEYSRAINHLCCRKAILEKEISGSEIKIFEVWSGISCKCMCFSKINATIGDISPGSYTVSVYEKGVQPDNEPMEQKLIIKKEITIN